MSKIKESKLISSRTYKAFDRMINRMRDQIGDSSRKYHADLTDRLYIDILLTVEDAGCEPCRIASESEDKMPPEPLFMEIAERDVQRHIPIMFTEVAYI